MYWANGAARETIPWPTTTSGSPRGVGHRERAADLEHLAACRRARARQPSRGDPNPAAEPVHGADVDETPADVRLPVQHHRDGLPAEPLERRTCDSVERSPGRLVRAEPDRLHRPVGRRERRDGPGEAPVLHHLRAREHACEHGCACGDAGNDEQDAPRPPRESRAHEEEDVGDPSAHPGIFAYGALCAPERGGDASSGAVSAQTRAPGWPSLTAGGAGSGSPVPAST